MWCKEYIELNMNLALANDIYQGKFGKYSKNMLLKV
jgi:hypothetical protein